MRATVHALYVDMSTMEMLWPVAAVEKATAVEESVLYRTAQLEHRSQGKTAANW
jgi:hypothetical protein